jgi:hypothetical protein
MPILAGARYEQALTTLRGYADTWHEEINAALRAGAPLQADVAGDVRHLHALIDASAPLPRGTKLYRQVATDERGIQSLLDAGRGTELLLDPAFASMSTSRSIAQGFPKRAISDPPDLRPRLLFELSVDSSDVRGFDVDAAIDRWRDEEEILLPPNSRYVLHSVRRDPDALFDRRIVTGSVLAPRGE